MTEENRPFAGPQQTIGEAYSQWMDGMRRMSMVETNNSDAGRADTTNAAPYFEPFSIHQANEVMDQTFIIPVIYPLLSTLAVEQDARRSAARRVARTRYWRNRRIFSLQYDTSAPEPHTGAQCVQRLTCSICMDREIRLAFNCGHTSCISCSRKLKDCHMCKKPIRCWILLYL